MTTTGFAGGCVFYSPIISRTTRSAIFTEPTRISILKISALWHFRKCRSFALPNRPKYLCVPSTKKSLNLALWTTFSRAFTKNERLFHRRSHFRWAAPFAFSHSLPIGYFGMSHSWLWSGATRWKRTVTRVWPPGVQVNRVRSQSPVVMASSSFGSSVSCSTI